MGEVVNAISDIRGKLIKGDFGGAKRKLDALTKHSGVIKSKGSSLDGKINLTIRALNTVKKDIHNYEKHKDKPTAANFISEAVQGCNEAWGHLQELKEIAKNL